MRIVVAVVGYLNHIVSAYVTNNLALSELFHNNELYRLKRSRRSRNIRITLDGGHFF